MSTAPARPRRRIVWLNVVTVVSAAILIGAEVFGAAFAGSWAIASLLDLGGIGARVLDVVLMLCGVAIMVQFVRSAHLHRAVHRARVSRRDAGAVRKKLRKICARRTNSLASREKNVISEPAQFRTCLWPCVGR